MATKKTKPEPPPSLLTADVDADLSTLGGLWGLSLCPEAKLAIVILCRHGKRRLTYGELVGTYRFQSEEADRAMRDMKNACKTRSRLGRRLKSIDYVDGAHRAIVLTGE